MATARRQESGGSRPRVLVSNAAANMIASLHPFNESKASAALTTIRSSVLDSAKARKIVGVDNAFVVRAGDLRVVFKHEGDSLVITAVLAQA